jgi:20S proteasome subunit beta 2
MEKLCMKLHPLAPNMYCAGAGTAADCDWVTKKMRAELEMMRLNTGRPSKVCQAYTRLSNQLIRYGGYIGAHLIIGGMDESGRHLVTIDANGMVISQGFACMGSGSLAAMAVMEIGFKDGMTEAEGLELCSEAITAGIIHDLGYIFLQIKTKGLGPW